MSCLRKSFSFEASGSDTFALPLLADAIAQRLTRVPAEPHLTAPGERMLERDLPRDLHHRGVRVVDHLFIAAGAQLAVHFGCELFVIHVNSLSSRTSGTRACPAA